MDVKHHHWTVKENLIVTGIVLPCLQIVMITRFHGMGPGTRCWKCKSNIQYPRDIIWLVVSTHLTSISQTGNLPQIGVKIKHIWNHHLVIHWQTKSSKPVDTTDISPFEFPWWSGAGHFVANMVYYFGMHGILLQNEIWIATKWDSCKKK